MTEPRVDPLPRLPGESPCAFVNGHDGWSNCAVHGWTGYREDRKRVLVCPNVNDAATPPASSPVPPDLREAVEAFIAWQYRVPGARPFPLTALRAALSASPVPPGPLDVVARSPVEAVSDYVDAATRLHGLDDLPDESRLMAATNAVEADLGRASSPAVQPAIRHGRHCGCSACARENWADPDLAPCDYHPGVQCIYSPGAIGQPDTEGRPDTLRLCRVCTTPDWCREHTSNRADDCLSEQAEIDALRADTGTGEDR